MSRLTILIILLLTSQLTFAEEVEVAIDDAWDLVIEAFLEMDAYPSTRDAELRVIKTDAIPMQLDSTTADCGSFFGIGYIKDKRTKTTVAYQVRLKKAGDGITEFRVKANIEGYFFENDIGGAFFLDGERDSSKVLECKSTGELEKQFIQSIRDAA